MQVHLIKCDFCTHTCDVSKKEEQGWKKLPKNYLSDQTEEKDLCPNCVKKTVLVLTSNPGVKTSRSIDDVIREHTLQTLEQTNGNKTQAARILGIERSTLDRKLNGWKVSASQEQSQPSYAPSP